MAFQPNNAVHRCFLCGEPQKWFKMTISENPATWQEREPETIEEERALRAQEQLDLDSRGGGGAALDRGVPEGGPSDSKGVGKGGASLASASTSDVDSDDSLGFNILGPNGWTREWKVPKPTSGPWELVERPKAAPEVRQPAAQLASPPDKKNRWQRRICMKCELHWRISVVEAESQSERPLGWATMTAVVKDSKNLNKGENWHFRGQAWSKSGELVKKMRQVGNGLGVSCQEILLEVDQEGRLRQPESPKGGSPRNLPENGPSRLGFG